MRVVVLQRVKRCKRPVSPDRCGFANIARGMRGCRPRRRVQRILVNRIRRTYLTCVCYIQNISKSIKNVTFTILILFLYYFTVLLYNCLFLHENIDASIILKFEYKQLLANYTSQRENR